MGCFWMHLIHILNVVLLKIDGAGWGVSINIIVFLEMDACKHISMELFYYELFEHESVLTPRAYSKYVSPFTPRGEFPSA